MRSIPRSLALACAITLSGGSIAARQLEYVQRAIGSLPQDCGYFEITFAGARPSVLEMKTALTCITDHAARRQPAWLRVYGPGIDSKIAHGLFTARDGQLQFFSYDSDPSGGSGARARFDTQVCEKPHITDSASVTCTP